MTFDHIFQNCYVQLIGLKQKVLIRAETDKHLTKRSLIIGKKCKTKTPPIYDYKQIISNTLHTLLLTKLCWQLTSYKSWVKAKTVSWQRFDALLPSYSTRELAAIVSGIKPPECDVFMTVYFILLSIKNKNQCVVDLLPFYNSIRFLCIPVSSTLQNADS